MPKMRQLILGAVVLLGTAGCDWLSGVEHPDPYFDAEVVDLVRPSGDDAAAGPYQGTGEFYVGNFGEDHPETWLKWFSITSSGTGESLGERIIFRKYGGDGHPSEGTYPFDLSYPDSRYRTEEGLTGQYVIVRPDSVREAYFIDSGELTITQASEDFVMGEFHVTAFRWCVDPNEDGADSWCQDGVIPDSLPAEIPRTEASGTFLVIEAELGVVTVEDGPPAG